MIEIEKLKEQISETIKKYKEIITGELVKWLDDWKDNYFPFRFGSSGQNRYHLALRKYKYMRQAKKKYPGWRPLVKTGRMFGVMIGNKSIRGKKSSMTAEIKIKRPHPTSTTVAEELIKINQNEVDEMNKRMIEEFTEKFGDKG